MIFLPTDVVNNKCRVCGEVFDSRVKFHRHLKKHNLILAEYYTKYYPKYNLLTREPIPFKKLEQYFLSDFENKEELVVWLQKKDPKTQKEYIIDLLLKEKEYKQLKYAPNYIDLYFSKRIPDMDILKVLCGSYYKLCERAGLKVFYDKKLPENFFSEKISQKIQIDSREQKPIKFQNSFVQKINYGDYCFKDFDVSVERKSLPDFIGTITQDLERFKSEINRCVDNNGYMFILVDETISNIYNYNENNRYKININALYAKIRYLTEEYRENIQFIFSGGRQNSKILIPRLLYFGKELKNVDFQYFLENVS